MLNGVGGSHKNYENAPRQKENDEQRDIIFLNLLYIQNSTL